MRELIRFLRENDLRTIFAALKAKDSPKASAATSVTPGSHSPADLPPLEKRIGRATKYIAKALR